MRIQQWLYAIPLRLRSLFWRRQVDQELDEELRYHVEQQTETLVASGLSPDEARRRALVAIGGLEQRKEECRDTRGVTLVDHLLRDGTHALRRLRRDAAFSIGALAILALGIGGTVTVATLVDAVLLEPLPYRDPHRLVVIREVRPELGERTHAVNPLHFLQWRDCRCLEDVALVGVGAFNLTGTDARPERIRSVLVTPNLFALLGVSAQLGRTFVAEDAEAETNGPVLISDGLWRRAFGADPTVIGRTVVLDGTTSEIAGVLPPSFRFHAAPDVASNPIDLYRPWAVRPTPYSRWEGQHTYLAIGRLDGDISLAAARDQLDGIQAVIAGRFESGSGHELRSELVPLQEWVTGESRDGLVLLFVAVATAFLVACANIANLVLARAATRRREIGLRAALGGSRQAIFRTALTEHAVLAALGAAGGLGVAAALLRLLPLVAPPGLPRIADVRLDWTALLVVAGLFVVATLAFGLLPAARAARVDPQHALRGDGAGPGRRLPQTLVAVEVALSVALLVTTGLLLTSLARLEGVDRGFDGDDVLTAEIWLPAQRYPDPGRHGDDGARLRFWEDLLERLEAEPDVVAAGVTSMLPLRGGSWGSFAVAEGDARPREEWLQVQYRWVSPGFFEAMGLPVLAGRAIGAVDGDRGVAVVSERAAEQLWPGEAPLGRWFGPGSAPDEQTRLEVIGVVPDVHSTDLAAARTPIVYVPFWRPGSPLWTVVIRTAIEPSAVVGTLRRVVSAMDPELPLANVQTMQDVARASVAARRFQLLAVGAFAAATLLIALTGIYSVLAYRARGRTREIAVRMALGARQGSVVRMVVAEGLAPVLVGVALGVGGALAFGRVLAALLFSVTPTHGPTFAGVVAVTLLAALPACLLPAWRAARTAPLDALRSE